MWNRRRSGLHVRQRELYKVEYLGLHVLPGTAATFVFPWVYLGKPDPTREIICAIISRNPTGRTFVSAALDNIVGIGGGGVTFFSTSIQALRFSASNPSQIGQMSITWSGTVADFCGLAVWRVTNRAAYDLAPSDTGSHTSSSSVTSSTISDVTAKPKGFIAGLHTHSNNGATTLTGADMKDDVVTPATTRLTSFMTTPADITVTPSIAASWTPGTTCVSCAFAWDYAT